MTLVKTESEFFDIYRSQVSTTPLTFSLKGIWTSVHPIEYIEKIEACFITGFKLCLSADCSQEPKSSIYSIAGTDLSINLSNPVTEETMYLTPVTFGGVMDPQKIKIKVCGNEILTTKNVGSLTRKLKEIETGLIKFDVEKLFENSDPLCPIDSYSLKSETGGAFESSDAIKLSNKTLTIDKSSPIEIKFKV